MDDERGPDSTSHLTELASAFAELHLQAGRPSSRALSTDLGRGVISHTTVNNVLKYERSHKWDHVELIARALARRADQDEKLTVARFRTLWRRATIGSSPREKRLAQNSDLEGRNEDSQPLRGPTPLAELLPGAIDELEAVAVRPESNEFRILTGFQDLNNLIGGWYRGSLVTISGASSSGKTNLLLTFCRTAAIRHGVSTLIMSLDLNANELQFRILSAEARVPEWHFRNGWMDDDEWTRVARRIAEIAESPIWIESISSLSSDSVREKVVDLSKIHNLGSIAIDGFDVGSQDTVSSGISLEELKAIALDYKLVVFLAMRGAHVDKVWDYPDPRTFREWPSVDRVADICLAIYRSDQWNPEDPRAGEADLIVAKHRNGPSATITVAYQGHFCRFVDILPPGAVVETPVPHEPLEDASVGGEPPSTEEDAE
ncbi:DnaB-like helicase C-terminal domain-containing protein [Nonomuraea fuscirosea]|uniref:DnaB-like helicase C-terminal domain-containing protein n=1 Tax=Nonomuraea fuscirosea TaxID=1291556 RepID=UPI0034243436